MYAWLQSAEGAIAGGVTNSYDGDYIKYPQNAPTFFNMVYIEQPVFIEPPSNGWFGFQTWSMERVAQYYYESKDSRVAALLKKWAEWANKNIKWEPTISIPAGLSWQGAPDTSFSSSGMPAANKGLHVNITSWNQDIGIMASLARTFMYIGRGMNNTILLNTAKKLLGAILPFEDVKGFSTPEPRMDYINKGDAGYTTGFNTPVYVPQDFRGKMPNGDLIVPGATFLSLRSAYKKDPDFKKIEEGYSTGVAPVFHYHRFWGQAEILLAFGMSAIFDESPQPAPQPAPQVNIQKVSITTKEVSQWQNNNINYYQQETTITNTSPVVVPNVSLKVTCTAIEQFWNSVKTGNTLSFPEWVVSSGGLKPTESITFGYIVSGIKPSVTM